MEKLKKLFKKDKIITILILIGFLVFFIGFVLICFHIDNYQIKGSISKIEKQNEIDETNATFIEMSDSNNYVYINKAGTYVLSGTCNDGYVLVNAKRQNIYLILDNLTLTSKTTSCIIIDDANQVFLNVKKNTVNTLNDSSSIAYYTVPSGTVKTSTGCIYSKDNLTINGQGTLNVNGNYSNGIACNDSLTIYGVTLNINSATHGLNVNDALVIDEALLTIKATSDGIHSINNSRASKNYCTILGGTVNITSGSDGIEASGNLGIGDGNITINASDSGLVSSNEVIIASGSVEVNSANHAIKANTAAILSGNIDLITSGDTSCIKTTDICYLSSGTINVNSNGDGINSENKFRLKDGSLTINAQDDGITSVYSLIVNDGTLDITYAYEGLECAYVTITGGLVSINAKDDGININCEPHEKMGGNNSDTYASSSGLLKITGGTVYVASEGDGLDSNERIKITGGIVIVSGPTNSANAAIDFDSSFKISGKAIVIACGSSGMAQAPTSGSRAVSVTFSTTYTTNTTILITDSSGNFVISYASEKSFSHIVINSPQLKYNKSYNMYVNSSVSGENLHGLVTSGSVNDVGTLFSTFTMSSNSVTIGQTSKGGMR